MATVRADRRLMVEQATPLPPYRDRNSRFPKRGLGDFMSSSAPFAAIEAGGTKFICALSAADGNILEQAHFPTRTPAETFGDMKRFFTRATDRHGVPVGAGLAAFGPVELDPAAAAYGRIGGTPKAGWSGADILGAVHEATGAPVAIDTDVNAAALGEGLHGAARNVANFAYVTVGTGIGVGVMLDGAVPRTFPHAEMGHMRIPRAPGDTFAGNCPFHGDCLEGLAAGPAMLARWQHPAEALDADHPGWSVASHYIAALCVNLTYMLRVERIVLGGGVMSPSFLLDRIRADFTRMMAGYATGSAAADPHAFLVAPQLTDPSPALVGAIELARCAAKKGPT